MAPRTVLITGFEPFDGHRLNVSWEVARALPARSPDGESWIAHRLPCTFEACAVELPRLLDHVQPDCVIALGQAEGRADITIERIAVNVRDARIPDNAGAQPIDLPVVEGAPLAYLSTLPWRALVTSLRESAMPVSLSNTAGTFVCNAGFFVLQHHLRDRAVPSGFVHLPILPEQRPDHNPTVKRIAREDAPMIAGRDVPVLELSLQIDTLALLIRRTREHTGPWGPIDTHFGNLANR
ncbi:MAG: Pyrrolidone-carboxylate peptidase [Pseudomonadota bacterium]|jgi:pyroglutamyl-peptidase